MKSVKTSSLGVSSFAEGDILAERWGIKPIVCRIVSIGIMFASDSGAGFLGIGRDGIIPNLFIAILDRERGLATGEYDIFPNYNENIHLKKQTKYIKKEKEIVLLSNNILF